jgi:hypothetical protein
MIEFTDTRGKKLTFRELCYYSTGINPAHLREILDKKPSAGFSFEKAFELEQKLKNYGFEIPMEFFLKENVKKVLKKYIENLTENLFTIREYNPKNGKLNDFNKIKAKYDILFEEIKGRVLDSFNINNPVFSSKKNKPH